MALERKRICKMGQDGPNLRRDAVIGHFPRAKSHGNNRAGYVLDSCDSFGRRIRLLSIRLRSTQSDSVVRSILHRHVASPVFRNAATRNKGRSVLSTVEQQGWRDSNLYNPISECGSFEKDYARRCSFFHSSRQKETFTVTVERIYSVMQKNVNHWKISYATIPIGDQIVRCRRNLCSP